MTELRYDRNYLYISKEEQEKIRDYPILIAGCGIGSNIAECALRLGFENITIVDGDEVELSNLNRQNYITSDGPILKADALHARLKAINSTANIRTVTEYLHEGNIKDYLGGVRIAVNALDYDTTAPKYFDQQCRELGIYVLHPYNLGWAGLLAIVTPEGELLESLSTDDKFNEINFVEYAIRKLTEQGTDIYWLMEILQKYKETKSEKSPPQLSVGSWLVAAMCTDIFFSIATRKQVKHFPDFYYSTIH